MMLRPTAPHSGPTGTVPEPFNGFWSGRRIPFNEWIQFYAYWQSIEITNVLLWQINQLA